LQQRGIILLKGLKISLIGGDALIDLVGPPGVARRASTQAGGQRDVGDGIANGGPGIATGNIVEDLCSPQRLRLSFSARPRSLCQFLLGLP
jgi:hypothetical protein